MIVTGRSVRWRRKAQLACLCILLPLVCALLAFGYLNGRDDATASIYSNQIGSHLKLLFCEAIAAAKESIYLEMYGLTDKEVLRLLNAKSRQGVAVRIRTDLRASPQIAKLLEQGIECISEKKSGLMHRKILVTDHTQLLLGSTNCTESSLVHHDNLVLHFLSPTLASFFEESTCSETCYTEGPQHIRAWKLPEGGGSALQAILDAIQNASHTIRIAMFTFTHPEILEALIRAHARGVRIETAIDHHSYRGSSKKLRLALQQEGILVKKSHGLQLLHHKWAWIDETILIAGSANWTRSAFCRNDDCVIQIAPLSAGQKRRMQRLWSAIERQCQEE